MIDIEGIPVLAARLAATQKKERRKKRRALLKLWRGPVNDEGRKPWSAGYHPEQAIESRPPL
jgi:hypothetical protein